MDTMHVFNKAKFIFDLSFTVYPDAIYEEVVVSDTLEPGLSTVGISTSDVTVRIQPSGEEVSIISEYVPEFIVPLDDSPEEIKVRITDPKVITPQVETIVTVSLPVFVNDSTALLTASSFTNNAVVTAGEEDDKMSATFNVIPENIALFTKKSMIENNTTDTANVTLSFPAIQSQPTDETIYVLTIDFNEQFADPKKLVNGKYEIHGILQREDSLDTELDRGTDFTATYTPRDTTDPNNIIPGKFVINIPHKEEYKGHTFYFYVPVTLAEPIVGLTDKTYLGSDVKITLLDLEDDNIHLTEVLPTHTTIKGGEKTVR